MERCYHISEITKIMLTLCSVASYSKTRTQMRRGTVPILWSQPEEVWMYTWISNLMVLQIFSDIFFIINLNCMVDYDNKMTISAIKLTKCLLIAVCVSKWHNSKNNLSLKLSLNWRTHLWIETSHHFFSL